MRITVKEDPAFCVRTRSRTTTPLSTFNILTMLVLMLVGMVVFMLVVMRVCVLGVVTMLHL